MAACEQITVNTFTNSTQGVCTEVIDARNPVSSALYRLVTDHIVSNTQCCEASDTTPLDTDLVEACSVENDWIYTSSDRDFETWLYGDCRRYRKHYAVAGHEL